MLTFKQLPACFMLILLFFPPFVFAKEQTTFFNQLWLKSVVSIEQQISGSSKPIGTGFLISTKNNHILLVTAKHVVVDETNKLRSDLAYRINLTGGESVLLSDDELMEAGVGNWFLSNTSDVAVRFMAIVKDADVLPIPQDMFLRKEHIQSATPALILGFPMGLRSEKYATPFVRQAVVALTHPDYFMIDGFTFPGNSGGPVVYMPTHQIGGIKLSNYIDKQMLIGIVSSYIPYQDTAVSLQTKRPRITFEENSGLTIVMPADEILNLVARNDVKTYDEMLK